MPAAIWIIPAVLLLVALAPLPYGYYTLLRLVVCVSAAFIAFKTWPSGGVWPIAFVVVAFLFNPLIPVSLDRGTWAIIDLIVASLYLGHWRFSRGKASV